MRRLLLVFVFLALAGCGGGDRVRERVWPPKLSVQELVVQANGDWALKLRLENFSNVGMRMDSVDAQLRVGDTEAGAIRFEPALTVPADSAEVFDYTLKPSSGAASALNAAVARGGSVRYSTSGTIRSSEPDRRRDEFTHESQLSPVPGLSGVLR